jgi:hypothetical protein
MLLLLLLCHLLALALKFVGERLQVTLICFMERIEYEESAKNDQHHPL